MTIALSITAKSEPGVMRLCSLPQAGGQARGDQRAITPRPNAARLERLGPSRYDGRMRNDGTVRILGIGTALPPHVLERAEVERRAEAMFAPAIGDAAPVVRMIRNAGVERRHMA